MSMYQKGKWEEEEAREKEMNFYLGEQDTTSNIC